MLQEDTISAIATAVGEGGIGIVRISGTNAIAVAEKLFRGYAGKSAFEIKSHQVSYGYIIDPNNGQIVDEALLLVMKAPKSYTKEDVVEIHCHGGAVPIRKVLALTLEYGARLAEPGEFTKRAFLNGRLDLTQAEAVIDIIRAKTDSSLKLAVNNLSGVLSVKVRSTRQQVLEMVAHLEAAIDFPEEDIEELAIQDVINRVKTIIFDIDELLSTASTGRILRDGLQTVIIGKPNVGKSSLLNALLREKRAIVTDIPGTTRDVIEEYLNIRGIPLKIVDTAGIRETADIVEQMGVERAVEFIDKAELILLLFDASSPLTHDDINVLKLLEGKEFVILVNKSDLPAKIQLEEVAELINGKKIIKISVTEGSGIDELEQYIVDLVYSGNIQPQDSAVIYNVRQADLLRQTKNYLQEVLATAEHNMPPDCLVVDLRNAWECLGKITGEAVAEDIIDQIFTQFCIGK